jgi:hypothetical protein
VVTFPRRVAIGSQHGTAMRRTTRADDDRYTDFLAKNGSTPILQPRSVVVWDGGFTTSTYDGALTDEEVSGATSDVRQGDDHPSPLPLPH